MIIQGEPSAVTIPGLMGATLGPFLSASVVVAVALFILREVWTEVRASRARARLRRAIALLIGEEIERNFWAMGRFVAVLENLKDALEHPDLFRYKVITVRGRPEFERRYVDGSISSGMALFPFSTARYEKLIDKIAELDEKLFRTLQEFYADMAGIQDWQTLLSSELAGSENLAAAEFPPDEFLVSLLENEEEWKGKFQKTYKVLTGADLKKGRLR